MSDVAELLADLEIPIEIEEAIASWRRTLGHARGNPGPLFQRAAVELWRIASVQPPELCQMVVDALYDMAVSAGISDEDAQSMLHLASSAAPDLLSGLDTPRIRLVAFDDIQLKTERRYLVKGLIPRRFDCGVGSTEVGQIVLGFRCHDARRSESLLSRPSCAPWCGRLLRV
jgi:hypothetical protein